MRVSILALMLVILPSSLAFARPHRWGPRDAPPAPREEVVHVRAGWMWDGGHYGWRHERYVWMPGHYVRERPGYEWQPGGWEHRDEVYVWRRGGWHPHR